MSDLREKIEFKITELEEELAGLFRFQDAMSDFNPDAGRVFADDKFSDAGRVSAKLDVLKEILGVEN